MREFDELAKATFNLWKFMPATQAGKPLIGLILVRQFHGQKLDS